MRVGFGELLRRSERPCRISASLYAHSTDPSDVWERIYLQSPLLPIRHIEHCFVDLFEARDVRRERAEEFNQCLHWYDGIPPAAKGLVTLLKSGLALPTTGSAFDLLMALDWYKIPDDTVPPESWPNTESGELVRRAKYFKSSPNIMAAAQAQLAQHLATTVEIHPALQDAPYLVSVPGSQGNGRSSGERIAGLVAETTGKQLVSTIGPPRPDLELGVLSIAACHDGRHRWLARRLQLRSHRDVAGRSRLNDRSPPASRAGEAVGSRCHHPVRCGR
jgi:hypothetical protein